MKLNHRQKLEQITNPGWNKTELTHDWRDRVPDEVQELWPTFTTIQQHALFKWAEQLTDRN